VAAFRVSVSDQGMHLAQDGRAFASLSRDPMPVELRLGQKLFYSANSDDVPVTRNHWVACASCHLEGRSDAVTWKFVQGPRDTPTNAGGLLDTGFLFRTADRTRVQDYWQTIDVEQGGHFDRDDAAQRPLLDALAEYVNYAIPTPVPPSTDAAHTLSASELAALRARGERVFEDTGCGTCHSGAAKTDSGTGNTALDLSGPTVSSVTPGGVLLHDVGTCVSADAGPSHDVTHSASPSRDVAHSDSPSRDVAHSDIDGHAREACAFDTPQLRGLWDSAPYLHDGSAATLADVLPSMLAATAAPGTAPPELTSDDRQALIEYLRSL
jgi:cytochrome c peroxidase